MKKRFVLDAWAILVFLQGEAPAATRVKRLLEEAQAGQVELFISIINLGEVIYRIGKVKGKDEAWETLNEIRRLPLTIVSATEAIVFSAVQFKIRYAISYADAFAAATTRDLEAVLVTGDPELQQLGNQIRIERLERQP